MAEAEGIADRDHPVADADLVGIAELHGRQRLLARRLDLQHGKIGARVGADQLGLELGIVAQDDGDVLGALDHVVVGDHVAVGIDDEARAQRGAAALLLLLSIAAVEEFLEQLLERRARRELRHVAQPRALLRQVLRRGDVDHGRHQHVDHVGEALRRIARLGRRDNDRLHHHDAYGGRHGQCRATAWETPWKSL